jgi:hypothetical protein
MKKPESQTKIDLDKAAEDLGHNAGVPSLGPQGNALKHGLTATKLAQSILKPGRAAAIAEHLRRQPDAWIEDFLIRDIAYHATMLEISEAAEAAVLRQGATSASILYGRRRARRGHSSRGGLNHGRARPSKSVSAFT